MGRSKVVDKYKPIAAEPRTASSPWRVIPALLVLFAAMLLYNAETVHTWVVFKEGAPAWQRSVANTLLSTSRALGVVWVRGQVDGLLKPFVEGSPVLMREVAPAVAEAPEEPEPPRR